MDSHRHGQTSPCRGTRINRHFLVVGSNESRADKTLAAMFPMGYPDASATPISRGPAIGGASHEASMPVPSLRAGLDDPAARVPCRRRSCAAGERLSRCRDRRSDRRLGAAGSTLRRAVAVRGDGRSRQCALAAGRIHAGTGRGELHPAGRQERRGGGLLARRWRQGAGTSLREARQRDDPGPGRCPGHYRATAT